MGAINPFHTTGLFLYPPENIKTSEVFGYFKGLIGRDQWHEMG